MILFYLQIIFTIISALFIAAFLPVGAFLGWNYAIACGVGAFVFYALMIVCKQARGTDNSTQNDDDNKENSQEKDK